MFGPAIGGQPSLTLPSPSSSVLFRHCGPTSGGPTAGQPSLTKPSPSSSRLLLHCPPDSPTPGGPPALGFATMVWSKASIGTQVPLCRYPMELTVGVPPPGSQSWSTHWSTLSPPAEVAEKA